DPRAITMGPLIGTVLDPDVIFMASYWSGSARRNWAGTPLPEQEALDEMMLRQRTLLDIEERTALIKDIQRSMAEIMIVIPSVNASGLIYAQPWLENFNWKASAAAATDTFAWAYFTEERLAQE